MDVGVLSLAEVNVAMVCSKPLLLCQSHPSIIEVIIKEQVSASVPAVFSFIRKLTGNGRTVQPSFESPGRPSGSVGDAPFPHGKNKGSRSRWQGFTDVFTTQASGTIVSVQSRSCPAYSNDELELLDETDLERPEPRTWGCTADAY